jgi:hypothetical protein
MVVTMSNPKLRIFPREGRLLRPRRESSEIVLWNQATAIPPESCRWVAVDGRWVSITLCHESDLSKAMVRDSSGRSELVDSYEEALALAKRLRD